MPFTGIRWLSGAMSIRPLPTPATAVTIGSAIANSDPNAMSKMTAAAPMPIAESYPDFQAHLEKAFGPPNRSSPGEEGFPTYEWVLPTARIIHVVQGRFDLEEHVRIQLLAP